MRKSLHLWQHPSLLRIIISKCGWCNERFFFPEWLRSWSTVYIMLLTLMVNGKIKSSSYLNMKFWKRWMVSSSKTISIRHERLDHKSVRVITESSTGTWIVWLTKNEKTGRSVSSTIQQISVTPSQAKEIQTMSDKQEIYDCMCMSYGDQTSPFAHRVPPPHVNNLPGMFSWFLELPAFSTMSFFQWQTFTELICIETSSTSHHSYQLHIVCGFPQD